VLMEMEAGVGQARGGGFLGGGGGRAGVGAGDGEESCLARGRVKHERKKGAGRLGTEVEDVVVQATGSEERRG
jgi:hypothetical protein